MKCVHHTMVTVGAYLQRVRKQLRRKRSFAKDCHGVSRFVSSPVIINVKADVFVKDSKVLKRRGCS